MKRFRDPGRQAWMVGVMIGLVALAGCSTWKPRLKPIDEDTRFDYNARVIATLADGTQVKLDHPYVARDTLWGYAGRALPPGSEHLTTRPSGHQGWVVGCPVDAVRLIETRQPSPARTAGLCLVVGTLAAVTVIVIALAADPISISFTMQ